MPGKGDLDRTCGSAEWNKKTCYLMIETEVIPKLHMHPSNK
jgi:hypothetical protein